MRELPKQGLVSEGAVVVRSQRELDCFSNETFPIHFREDLLVSISARGVNSCHDLEPRNVFLDRANDTVTVHDTRIVPKSGDACLAVPRPAGVTLVAPQAEVVLFESFREAC